LHRRLFLLLELRHELIGHGIALLLELAEKTRLLRVEEECGIFRFEDNNSETPQCEVGFFCAREPHYSNVNGNMANSFFAEKKLQRFLYVHTFGAKYLFDAAHVNLQHLPNSLIPDSFFHLGLSPQHGCLIRVIRELQVDTRIIKQIVGAPITWLLRFRLEHLHVRLEQLPQLLPADESSIIFLLFLNVFHL